MKFIVKVLILGIFAAILAGRAYPTSAPDKPVQPKAGYFVYIGTDTRTPAKSKGIYLFRYDTKTSHLTPLGVAAELRNPRWITTDPQHRFLYALEEIGDDKAADGTVSSYSIDPKTGSLEFLNKVPSEGGNPTYVAVDRTGKMLLAANYLRGTVLSWAIKPDGSIGDRTGFDQHTGSSVDPKRQPGPRNHSVVFSPDNRFVFVPDMGLDKICIYRLNPAKATFTPNDPPFASVPPGIGPRHLIFGADAKFAYVVSEMGANVVVLSYDKSAGAMKVVQTISSLPSDFKGASAESSEIGLDHSGRFLYTSNTGGENSITVFRIDPKNGTLTKIQTEPTRGEIPRSFAIDPSGKYLLVGNMRSDTIVTFAIDQNSGLLAATSDVTNAPAPACFVFVPTQ